MIDVDLRSDLRRTFASALDRDDAAAAREQLLGAGWLDAIRDDEPVAVALLFRLQGELRRDAGALDDVVVHHLADRCPSAAGDVAVAYPVALSHGHGSDVTHVAFPAHRHAPRLLWIDILDSAGLRIIDVKDGLGGKPLAGVDPSLGLHGFSARPVGPATDLTGEDARAAWSEALAAGRIAVAHQMVASARALLTNATEYARARRQFGVPIGSFQAVKHRLAETLVAIGAADAMTVAAATTPSSTHAALAKVLAGRAATATAKNCLQVFGGVGFTTEHDFHRFFRRMLVLDRLLGDSRSLERALGSTIRAGALNNERVIDLSHAPRVDLLDATNG
jgi:alkylation response protein AidB-like acyl-CoA dehydrogenase